MAPELRATLHSVAEAMAPFPQGWWIISSGAVALHGAEAGQVKDVDLLVDETLGPAVLKRLNVAPLVMSPNALFRSTIFARWQAQPVPVELMAGFRICVDGHWHAVTLLSRHRIVIDGTTLFVPDRQELLSLYRLFGRSKDASRIAALEQAGAVP